MGGYKIAFIDNRYPHLEQIPWFCDGSRSLFPTLRVDVQPQTLSDTESGFHEPHIATASKVLLIERDNGLGQLESFLVYDCSISRTNPKSARKHGAQLWKDFYPNERHSRKTENTATRSWRVAFVL